MSGNGHANPDPPVQAGMVVVHYSTGISPGNVADDDAGLASGYLFSDFFIFFIFLLVYFQNSGSLLSLE